MLAVGHDGQLREMRRPVHLMMSQPRRRSAAVGVQHGHSEERFQEKHTTTSGGRRSLLKKQMQVSVNERTKVSFVTCCAS